MNAIHIDYDAGAFDDESDGSGINTGTLTDHPDLNIFNGPYTCMAWVNLDDLTAAPDHMVFGSTRPNAPGATSPSAGELHLGFRNGMVYYGWWGSGTTRDSAYDRFDGGGYIGQTGEWHHVAWSFDGSGMGGLQNISCQVPLGTWDLPPGLPQRRPSGRPNIVPVGTGKRRPRWRKQSFGTGQIRRARHCLPGRSPKSSSRFGKRSSFVRSFPPISLSW
jgi:hypothetical protein